MMENEIIVKKVRINKGSNLQDEGVIVHEVKQDNSESLIALLKNYWNPKELINYSDEVSRKDFWITYLLNYFILTLLYIPFYVVKDGHISLFLFVIYTAYCLFASSSFLARRANSAGISTVWSILFYSIICAAGSILIIPFMSFIFDSGIFAQVANGTTKEEVKQLILSSGIKPEISSVAMFLLGSLLWVISGITYTIIGVLGDKNGK